MGREGARGVERHEKGEHERRRREKEIEGNGPLRRTRLAQLQVPRIEPPQSPQSKPGRHHRPQQVRLLRRGVPREAHPHPESAGVDLAKGDDWGIIARSAALLLSLLGGVVGRTHLGADGVGVAAGTVEDLGGMGGGVVKGSGRADATAEGLGRETAAAWKETSVRGGT